MIRARRCYAPLRVRVTSKLHSWCTYPRIAHPMIAASVQARVQWTLPSSLVPSVGHGQGIRAAVFLYHSLKQRAVAWQDT